MAWPNPFRRHTPNTRTCWGYTFELTDEHLTEEECYPLKHSYDVLAEECLDRLNEISPPPRSALPRNNGKYAEKEQVPRDKGAQKAPRRDLYALLRDHADTDEKLGQLWREVNTVPDWVDWDQIERGQDVFYRYGGAALTGLAYQSLLGGMGAARVVETLARTGGFSTKVARHRLFETTQHILQCTKSLESLKPGGDGFASSIRVRLLHAAVRQRIMKLAKQKPEYYSVEKWGIPINDLDSIATIGTFSATLIWLSFPRQGIFLREQEITDYIALWRYIGYIVGCPTDQFETPSKAKAVMETLLLHEIDPTETSKILANNIIKSLEDQPPGYASADFLIASARWLNGNELCDCLGLARPGIYYWALMTGQCLFFMAVCYGYRSIPYLDRRKITTLKRAFYQIIVESKYGLAGTETMFEYKYVPEFSTITEMGESTEAKLRNPGIERRNLKTLVIAVGFVGFGAWCSLKVASGLWHAVWR
ncbi:hypothetical protein BJ546DRAFT_1011364 [Cryomyces antarcticus]|uniref:ER-bound oxygenase mpaB/mpaB'/Rubber oxygenase catalytic domain-containing protein n=1 Tax=Cryomyces antarcticus TaxID=329879 RepID=A0ABR0KUI6_9PEZI|nr:hypothetical protein LTR16_000610 [Cryomyces antarcticus]